MNKYLNSNRLLFLLLFSHLLIWTLVPSLTNQNLPLDTIEALAWGSNLEWGYNKHPPLSAFVVEIFYQIFGSRDWAYYFLSQIFVIIAFLVVYKFSQEFLKNKKLAFLSVLLLEAIYFYNFTTPEFNVNVAQLPFWALSIYYTWRCLKYDKASDYVFLGIFAGLGILSKYLFVYLILGIKLIFIYYIKKRKKIRFSHYFIAGPITLLILLPHLIWLNENNYITITYAFLRTGGVGDFLDHLIYPLIFLSKQIGILIPFFILTFFLTKRINFKINFKDEKLVFILLITIVPIIFILLTSMIMGVKIRTMWMTPFYLFLGTLVIYIIKSKINFIRLKVFVSFFLILFFLSPFTYAYVSISQTDKRTDYPGKKVAIKVKRYLNERGFNEISKIIGNEWLAGNLCYHLKPRPKFGCEIISMNNVQIISGNSMIEFKGIDLK